MKLLLHACCGPCSLEPTRLLKAAGHDITIYYANSNIHPAEEYEHRLATLRAWAADAGFEVLEGPYDRQRGKRARAVSETPQSPRSSRHGRRLTRKASAPANARAKSIARAKPLATGLKRLPIRITELHPLMALPFSQAQQAAPPPAPPCCRSTLRAERRVAAPAIAFAWRKPRE